MTTVERSPGLEDTRTEADETQTQAASATRIPESSAQDDVLDYLDAVFGDGEGYVMVLVGIDGYISKTGAYDHARYVPGAFEWPAQRDELIDAIGDFSPEADFYLCPYLMPEEKRSKYLDGIDMRMIHADGDGKVDIDKVREINGFAVGSGTPGHAHVYVSLSESVERHEHERLCRALGIYLGDADAKISTSDVLRPPGTLNHKARARGQQSRSVEWLVRPDGARWDPEALAALLDADKVDVRKSTRRERDTYDYGEPFDLSRYPKIKAAIDEMSLRADELGTDRSFDTFRVVAAVKDAGLTIVNAEWAVRQRGDLAERLDDRGDDDLLTCWDRVEEKEGDGPRSDAVAVTDRYQDAYIGEQIARDHLEGRFIHTRAFGWMNFDGRRWKQTSENIVYEEVRQAVIKIHLCRAKSGADSHELKLVSGLLSSGRIGAILRIAKGYLAVEAEEFDA